MKIGVNATYITQNSTGLSVYSYNIINSILEINPNIITTVYTQSLKLKEKFPYKINCISHLLDKHHIRLMWENTLLPYYCKLDNIRILYNLIPEGIFAPYIYQITTVHDIIPYLFPQYITFKNRYYFSYLLPLLLKYSKKIICISHNTKKDIISNFNINPSKIHVVYAGVKFENKKNKIDVLKKYNISSYIFYIGDMRPYKNLKRALEGFSKVKLRDLYFIIGGKKDKRYYPELEKKVKELSIQDRVIFAGYIPEDELSSYYSQAKLLIFPSLYEGFGLPPLEAMYYKCPVIVSNTSSLPEVCGDSAYYINPYKTEDIAQGIYDLIKYENLRKKLIEKGIQRVKLFTWESAAENILKILETTVKEYKKNKFC